MMIYLICVYNLDSSIMDTIAGYIKYKIHKKEYIVWSQLFNVSK